MYVGLITHRELFTSGHVGLTSTPRGGAHVKWPRPSSNQSVRPASKAGGLPAPAPTPTGGLDRSAFEILASLGNVDPTVRMDPPFAD